jgi:hypothetical protein
MIMPRLFPGSPLEWARVLLLPFQAYAVLAVFVERYFSSIWPPDSHSMWRTRQAFQDCIAHGYLVCFFVFLAVGIRQLVLQRSGRASLHFGFAVLSLMLFHLVSTNFFTIERN